MLLWIILLAFLPVAPFCAALVKNKHYGLAAGALGISFLLSGIFNYFFLPAHVGFLGLYGGNLSYLAATSLGFTGLMYAIRGDVLEPLIEHQRKERWPETKLSMFARGQFVLAAVFQLFWLVPSLYMYFPGGAVAPALINVVGSVEEIEMADALGVDISTDQGMIRRVSTENSLYLAGLRIAESREEALKTLFAPGPGTVQMVGGELVIVHPLEYNSDSGLVFWKWKNNEGTGGYLKVSVLDEEKQELVETCGDEPVVMKYVPTALFWEDLERYVYQRGYDDRLFVDISFQLDDSCRPYYVIHTGKPTLFWDAVEPTGVLVVDPQTGAISEEVPEWLERVISESTALDLVSWNGAYQGGWWNKNFGQKLGVLNPTSYGENEHELFFVPGSDGQFYWITGMTSASTRDVANDRFSVVNAKTGVVTEFATSGVNELGALNLAIDLFQPRGNRVAVQAIPYPIYGRLGYVVLIMADAQRLQEFVIVDAQSQKTGQGSDLAEALRNFAVAIGEEAPVVQDPIEGEIAEATGIVSSVASYVTGGETVVIFTVEGIDKAFQGRASQFLPDLPLLAVGQSVSLEFIDVEDLVRPLHKFSVE